ncbi:hypothetical protein [Streptomyces tsukubensis]|uniref:Uncharacterized protein n=1 Tax=Streptomyces tsukubensis TaxID=83656 RepID=A0A1V4A996_9ACTN|nr:hypothetical protein [Streptomyces tsukubensis]OON80051.1 hypothetical protein B1H18_12800 [Streptomyces tsukubensis]QFR97285.1 hypothetical protein GBW32_34765 [Streptomyces tsukubensis]
MQPRTIDEALDDAMIPDVFADYDLAASRQEIARDVAGALLFDSALALGAGTARAHQARPVGRLPTVHDQARDDLDGLCAQTLGGIDAAGHLARLVNGRRIDPDGALHFASLLNLAGSHEAAQFWWQFAAGAGNSTAAYCLHLLHLARGERRDAAHWAGQAADLDAEPRPHPAGRLSIRQPVRRRRRGPTDALRAAVARLTTDEDEEFGSVPHPDPDLADHIEELAEAL